MADQFERKANQEQERKQERRHKEFIGVVERLRGDVGKIDAAFNKMDTGSSLDPESARVFANIDKATMKSIDLDEKFARQFSSQSLKQLDVLGAVQKLNAASSKHLESINQSTGQNLGHIMGIAERFRNFFGLLPGRGARKRTEDAEKAQIRQRNTLRTIRDINQRQLLESLKLNKIFQHSSLADREEKREERKRRQREERDLLKALGLLKPEDRESTVSFAGVFDTILSGLQLGVLAGGLKLLADQFAGKDGFLGMLGNFAEKMINAIVIITGSITLPAVMKLFKSFKPILAFWASSTGSLLRGLNGMIGMVESLFRGPKAFFGKDGSIVRLFVRLGVRIKSAFETGLLMAMIAGDKIRDFFKPLLSMFKDGGKFAFVGKFLSTIGGFFKSLMPMFETVRGFLKPVMRVVGILARVVGKLFLPLTIVMGIIDGVMGFINTEGDFGEKMVGGLQGVLDGLLRPFAMIFDWVGEKLGIGKIGSAVLDPLLKITEGIFNAVISPFRTIFNFVTKFFSGDFEGGILALFEGIFDWVSSIPKALLNAIGSLFGVSGMGDDFFGMMKDVWMSIFGPVASALGSATEFIVSAVMTVMSAIGDAVNYLLSWIGLGDEVAAGRKKGVLIGKGHSKLMRATGMTQQQIENALDQGSLSEALMKKSGLSPSEIEALFNEGNELSSREIDRMQDLYFKTLAQGGTEADALEAIAGTGISNEEEVAAVVARLHVMNQEERNSRLVDMQQSVMDLMNNAVDKSAEVMKETAAAVPELVEAATADFVEASLSVRDTLINAINEIRSNKGLANLTLAVQRGYDDKGQIIPVPMIPDNPNGSFNVGSGGIPN